jgi:hypothetical protein
MRHSDDQPGSRYLPPKEWQEQTFHETYKSQIHLVIEGLKLLAIANGGAAVALLSLLGSLAGRCSSLPFMTWQIGLFALGLVFCVLGFFASYLAQMAFLKWLATKDESWKTTHVSAFFAAAVAILFSVAIFFGASISAAKAFQAFAPKCATIPLP